MKYAATIFCACLLAYGCAAVPYGGIGKGVEIATTDDLAATSAIDRAYADVVAITAANTARTGAIAQVGMAVPGLVTGALPGSIASWAATGSVAKAGSSKDSSNALYSVALGPGSDSNLLHTALQPADAASLYVAHASYADQASGAVYANTVGDLSTHYTYELLNDGTYLQPTGDGSHLSGITAAFVGAASTDALSVVATTTTNALNIATDTSNRLSGAVSALTLGDAYRTIQSDTQSWQFVEHGTSFVCTVTQDVIRVTSTGGLGYNGPIDGLVFVPDSEYPAYFSSGWSLAANVDGFWILSDTATDTRWFTSVTTPGVSPTFPAILTAAEDHSGVGNLIIEHLVLVKTNALLSTTGDGSHLIGLSVTQVVGAATTGALSVVAATVTNGLTAGSNYAVMVANGASNGAVSVSAVALVAGLTAGSNYASTVAGGASNGAVAVSASAMAAGLTAGSNYAGTVANGASNGAVSVAAMALGVGLTAGSNYAVMVAGSASNGAISVITNLTFQSFATPYAIPSATNIVLSWSNGFWQRLSCATSPVVIYPPVNTNPAVGISFRVDVVPGTNSVSFSTAFSNYVAVTWFGTNSTTPVLVDQPFGQVFWELLTLRQK